VRSASVSTLLPRLHCFLDKGFASFVIQNWLFEVFDSYILDNGDLDAALQDAQTYAAAFQSCTANLPSFYLDRKNDANVESPK